MPVVTPADGTTHSSGALRLLLTAERLFALHGIAGVSLRQVAAEAGSANNSAVHYHFGTKDALITAILEYRLPQIVRERQLLASRATPHDLRSRLEVHFLPVLTLAEAPDNHYVSFVDQLFRAELPSGRHFAHLPEEGQRSNEEFNADLDRLLGHLEQRLRQLRIMQAQALYLHAASDRELAVARGGDVPPFELFVSSLLDGMTGYLSAPASEATLRRLADPVDVSSQRSEQG